MRKEYKRISVFISLCLLTLTNLLFAQQDAQWSHYMFNQHYYNPGYVGVEEMTRATLLHRTQWLGYEATIEQDRAGGAPSQQQISVVHPMAILGSKSVNSGIGLLFNNDKLGPWTKQDLKLDLSYHIHPSFGGTIGLGGRVGFQSQTINGAILRATDDGDFVVEQFGSGKVKQTKPDFGAGIYYRSSKLYVNLAISHLYSSSYDFGANSDSLKSSLAKNLWIGGGYNIMLTKFVITPSFHYKADFNHSSYNLGALAQYDNYKYWLGLNFRQSFVDQGSSGKKINSDDVVFLVGIGLLKQNALRIGYAFDLVSNGVGAKASTSHEFMISYAIPKMLSNHKTPIKDPRYQHKL